ncbi:MAG: hypothetical protein WBP67_10455, partial [Thermoanaerobaculia bacterium]
TVLPSSITINFSSGAGMGYRRLPGLGSRLGGLCHMNGSEEADCRRMVARCFDSFERFPIRVLTL